MLRFLLQIRNLLLLGLPREIAHERLLSCQPLLQRIRQIRLLLDAMGFPVFEALLGLEGLDEGLEPG